MAPALLKSTTASAAIPTVHGGGNGFHGGGSFPGGGGGGEFPRRLPAHTYRLGMWLGLIPIVMLFVAFTSAGVVRSGLSTDWAGFTLPRVLWLNTMLLLASSATLELSRRSLTAGLGRMFAGWLYTTAALGLAFVGGQLMAWRELIARGVYLATNPSSSFFYLLTAAHGVHLLGGIAALLYMLFRARVMVAEPARRTALEVTAIYRHFMDGLWIYIFFLIVKLI